MRYRHEIQFEFANFFLTSDPEKFAPLDWTRNAMAVDWTGADLTGALLPDRQVRQAIEKAACGWLE